MRDNSQFFLEENIPCLPHSWSSDDGIVFPVTLTVEVKARKITTKTVETAIIQTQDDLGI